MANFSQLLIILVTGCISFWITSGFFIYKIVEDPEMAIIAILAVALSLIRPAWAITILLAVAPLLGGNYPGTTNNAIFYIVFSGFVLGLCLRHIRSFLISPSQRLELSDAVTYGLSGIVISGILSLSSLPWDEVIVRWEQLQPSKPYGFLVLKEAWIIFPLLKLATQIQSLYIFFLIRFFPDSWEPRPMTWLRAILIGLLLTASVGLLDYYGIWSLSSIREVATGIGPDGRPLRLQSTFGHPAWCAMFVAVAIPSVLCLLNIGVSRWISVGLIIGLLIMGEYVLLLTFSRGSWVTYPLTLLAIWFSIYALQTRYTNIVFWATTRRSIKKILISIPLTIIISLTLVRWIGGEDPDRYLQRFKDISKATDRTLYLKPAFELFTEHPLLGGGLDSFTYRYAQEFVVPTGRHADEKNPLGNAFNNAHSAYLQILQGKGIGGIITFLAAIYAILLSFIRIIRAGFYVEKSEYTVTLNQRVQIVFGLCLTISYMVYGLFDDVFYTPALTMFFYAGLGLAFQGIPPAVVISARLKFWILIVTAMTLALNLFWEYGYPGETRNLIWPEEQSRCYPEEQETQAAHKGVWCTNRFTSSARTFDIEGKTYMVLPLQPVSKTQKIVNIRVSEAGEVLGVYNVPSGIISWLVASIQESNKLKTPGEIIIESNATGIVPALDPDHQSLDRRKFVLFLSNDELPWSGAVKKSECLRILQSEVLACGQGAEVPSWKSFKQIKFADSMMSQVDPLWVWVKTTGGAIYAKRIDVDRWYSLDELDIARGLEVESIYVSRLGVLERSSIEMSSSQGWYAFELR